MIKGRSRQMVFVCRSKAPEVNFAPEDPILLKVFSTKGSVKFGKRGKPNLRYVGPFEVFEQVGVVAYM